MALLVDIRCDMEVYYLTILSYRKYDYTQAEASSD